MRRLAGLILTFLIVVAALSVAAAQGEPRLQQGDPPIASLIVVSAPDADGLVTITGAAGSVFPAAQVAVRNLYTGDTVYAQAGLNGSFSAVLYGPGNTPFWVSPANNIPQNLRDLPGSLPGGPGTIIYGTTLQNTAQSGTLSGLVIDGNLGDWSRYQSQALITPPTPTIFALLNQNSLYFALSDRFPVEYAQMVLSLALDNANYDLTLDPRQAGSAAVSRDGRAVGTIAIAAAQTTAIELRIPRQAINPAVPLPAVTTLQQVRFVGADGSDLLVVPVGQPVPAVDEVDGITRLESQIGADFTRFTVSGMLGSSANRWVARGRINQLAFQPGNTLTLELDVEMNVPDLPAGVVGLQMLGELRLQAVVGADGQQTAGGLYSNNGWSDTLTPSGIAISNLRGDFVLAESSTPANQILRQSGKLIFPLDFTVQIPADLPGGIYVPMLEGFGQVADGDVFSWQETSPLGASAAGSPFALTRLPVTLSVGTVTTGRLLWTLFQDTPSAGSRGVVAAQDQARYALANRVQFDSPTYILPPPRDGVATVLPIEPYMLNQMSNSFDVNTVPLIPFLFPGGRLSARITRPDGQVDDLGSTAIVQNQLSSAAMDERERFGAHSQVDVYRLTTLNPAFTQYAFAQYGAYQIELAGNLEDVWGNRYEGGGTYTVLVAEALDVRPAVLPGTPFEVGNSFHSGVHLAPGLPADVTVTLRLYPLDGGEVVETQFSGQANAQGYFTLPDSAFRFEAAGEYVVEYEARYTDAEGRLWAGSERSAGIVASPAGQLIAHGRRGVDTVSTEPRPAWFTLRQYAPNASPVRMNTPYHTGDVLWITDGRDSQLNPIITVQDRGTVYADWLWSAAPGYQALDGTPLRSLVIEESLPVTLIGAADAPVISALDPTSVVNRAYSYVSAVTPAVNVRQFVQGGVDGALPLYFDLDDPLNGQVGAGVAGLRPGDYIFLFGGAVVRNDDINLSDASIYASLGIVTDGRSDALGPRIYPPFNGEAGGGGTGPLMTVLERPVEMFFHPTAAAPGDVLHVGDVFSVAGQVAPTLPSIVTVTITEPDGSVRQFEGVSSAIGYFYNPAQDFVVDQPGVWTVRIQTRHEGVTSVGAVEPPAPTGGVLGTSDGTYHVYVLPADTQPLEWSDTRSDFNIPAASQFNFRFSLPADWENIRIYHTLTTPAYVVEDAPLPRAGSTFSYQYYLQNYSRLFPNIEEGRTGTGAAAADTITLTFAVTGTDADGTLQIRTRTFTIAFDRLFTFG